MIGKECMLTQPVQETEKEGLHYLVYRKVETDVLNRMEHLREICGICARMHEGETWRLVLRAPNREIALQAAAAVVNLKLNGVIPDMGMGVSGVNAGTPDKIAEMQEPNAVNPNMDAGVPSPDGGCPNGMTGRETMMYMLRQIMDPDSLKKNSGNASGANTANPAFMPEPFTAEHSNQHTDPFAGAQPNLFTDPDADDIEYIDGDEDEDGWEEYTGAEDRDCFLLDQAFFFPEQEDMQKRLAESMSGQFDLSTAARMERKMRETRFLLLECPDGIRHELLERIRGLEPEILMIWTRPENPDETAAERLIFEQQFRVISVRRPKESWYEFLMEQYLGLAAHALARQAGIRTCLPEAPAAGADSDPRSSGLNPRALLRDLKRYRGSFFREMDIFRYVENAGASAVKRGESVLRAADFALTYVRDEADPMDSLNRLIGLSGVKKMVERVCAARVMEEHRRAAGEPVRRRYHHLAFSGAPGTGKSEVASLYAKILAQERVTNGTFIRAQRADLIGEYVGHTAPKIRKLFQRADSGVILIDEAGCLTVSDEFTEEAVTELVRHMEENPQTTVIFATYPDQVEKFLDLDPGLRSRISDVISFPSYSDRELLQIFVKMVKDYGYRVQKGVEDDLRRYLQRMRSIRKESFGNAREMRKVVERSIEIQSVRLLAGSAKRVGDVGEISGSGGENEPTETISAVPPDWSAEMIPARELSRLSAEDVKQALKELLPGDGEARRIGFQPMTAAAFASMKGGTE